jgi:hypothetical protein
VVITANPDVLKEEVPGFGKIVLINREFNAEYKDKAFLNYDNLSEIIEDNNFFKNFINEER